MIGVFLRILKDKRNSLIVYILAALGFAEMYIALFPTIKEQAEELNKLLEAYPKGFMDAFGFESTEALFSRLEPFMSTEFFSFIWPIMVISMLISFAGAMIVNEIERGTIEVVLAQSISRLKLFFTRYLAGITYFLIFNGIAIFSMIFFASIHNIEYQLANYFNIFLISSLFGIAVFSIACFFSSLFSERGKAIFATAGIVLLMYVLNIVAGLKESLENLKYFSFFHYLNPAKVFGKNEIVDYSILVFLGAIVIFTALAATWFNKRDIAV